MEINGHATEAVKPNGEHPENEKKRQIEIPDAQEPVPATKRARVEDGGEVSVDIETPKTEVKPLPKGTAPIKPE
jgi:hypothetical protein